MPWLYIVGIGADGLEGLGKAAKETIEAAEILVGGDRHLAMIPPDDRVRIPWRSPLHTTVDQVLSYRQRHQVCILASGDPLWFGIGNIFTQHLPITELQIMPHISTFSLICARLGWNMAAVETLSLCGRAVELLRSHLSNGAKLLVLSSDRHTPKLVAALLSSSGYDRSQVWVLENLGGSQERIVAFLEDNQEFADLNAIAIDCVANCQNQPPSYIHDGQLTKPEVRAITLSSLAPYPGELLWDVGAGCGSIAIEWLRSHRTCQAIAIEKSRSNYIATNALNFGVPHLQIIQGIAPAVLADCPAPDAIFIGGGITREGMIETCWHALRSPGRLVANVVTLEGEQLVYQWQQKLGGSLTKIAIERAEPLGNFRSWKPMITVTQWVVHKKSFRTGGE